MPKADTPTPKFTSFTWEVAFDDERLLGLGYNEGLTSYT